LDKVPEEIFEALIPEISVPNPAKLYAVTIPETLIF